MTPSAVEEFAARLRSSVRLDELHSTAQPEQVLRASRRSQRRLALRTSAVAICGVVAVGLTGPLLVQDARPATEVQPATQPILTLDSAAPSSAPTPTDACADPAVATQVDEALKSTVESVNNSILVSPEEMLELGESEAAAAQQLEAWKKLSPAEVAFQQCLRARQGQPMLDPVPGADQ